MYSIVMYKEQSRWWQTLPACEVGQLMAMKCDRLFHQLCCPLLKILINMYMYNIEQNTNVYHKYNAKSKTHEYKVRLVHNISGVSCAMFSSLVGFLQAKILRVLYLEFLTSEQHPYITSLKLILDIMNDVIDVIYSWNCYESHSFMLRLTKFRPFN